MFKVQGSGFRVYLSGFRVRGSGFRVYLQTRDDSCVGEVALHLPSQMAYVDLYLRNEAVEVLVHLCAFSDIEHLFAHGLSDVSEQGSNVAQNRLRARLR